MSLSMECVLHQINKKCISLPIKTKKRNNKLLRAVVDKFLTQLKKDPLFKCLYQRIFYGGSYYDNLKVGQPDEYDLDVLLILPKEFQYEILLDENYPGCVRVKINNSDSYFENISQKEIIISGYLNANNLRRWMESLIDKILSNFPYENDYHHLEIGEYQLMCKMNKSAPANTLEIVEPRQEIFFTVDLVPCFLFDVSVLPKGKWRQSCVQSKNTFFIVPKPLKNVNKTFDFYWRLSFQEQERKLIHDKQKLKPSLKLIKRLRDVAGHDAIASYYIKTVFLWTDEQYGRTYWNGSLSNVFIKMLNTYIEYLEKQEILNFWNDELNMLTLSSDTLVNFTNRMKSIRDDIVRYRFENPKAIYQFFGNVIKPIHIEYFNCLCLSLFRYRLPRLSTFIK